MVKKRFRFGLLAGLAAASQIFAGFASSTQGYNLISFGNTNLAASDVEGKVAVGGANNIVKSYSIGLESEESAYSLVSNGNVDVTNASVCNGGIYSAGNVTLNSVNVEGDIVKYGTDMASVFNFNDVYAELNTASAKYATTLSNGTVTNNYGTLTFTGNADVNYFTLNASALKADYSNNLAFNLANSNAVSIVNIIGDVGVSSFNLNSWGNTSSKTLFNFTGVNDEFTILGTVNGSILAANDRLAISNGQINGQIAAASVTGGSQVNLELFDYEEEEVPEGSTTAMMIAGLFVLAFVSRKKILVSKN